VFFFSSRRRHTRLVSDWSSDVCSSDLFWAILVAFNTYLRPQRLRRSELVCPQHSLQASVTWPMPSDVHEDQWRKVAISCGDLWRSEERRVGKECRFGWGAGECKKESEM